MDSGEASPAIGNGEPTPAVSGRRPRGGDIAQAVPAVGAIWQVGFGIVAARYGAHWQIDDREAGALGDASVNVLRHNSLIPPKRFAIAVDVLGLITAVALITMPRWQHTQRLKHTFSPSPNGSGPLPAASAPIPGESFSFDTFPR